MKRKQSFGIIIAVMALIIALTTVQVNNTFAKIRKLEAIVDPNNIGVIYREEMLRDIETLKQQCFYLEIIGLTTLVFLIFSVFMLVLPSHSQVSKPRVNLMLPSMLSLLMVMALFGGNVWAENLYIRPRATIPENCGFYFLQEADVSMIVQASIVHDGFAAYLMGVGCPATREFLEVGYYQNSSGIRLYSSSQIGNQYQLWSFDSIAVGSAYDFAVFKFGNQAYVQINGINVNYAAFTSQTDAYDYVIQAETPSAYNNMMGTFRQLKVGYWKSSIEIYGNGTTVNAYTYVKNGWFKSATSIIPETPYTVEMISSTYYTGADIAGGLGLPSGSNPETRPDLYGCGGDIKKRQ